MTHEEYVDLVRKLREWQGGATNFTSGVFGLIAKADPGNMVKLKREWPELVRVYPEGGKVAGQDRGSVGRR